MRKLSKFNTILLVVLTLVLVLALVAACAGGGDETPDTGKPDTTTPSDTTTPGDTTTPSDGTTPDDSNNPGDTTTPETPKQTITGVTLSNATFEYDAKPHSIQVVGNVPAGVTVTYYYDGVEASSVTAVGTHEVKAVLSGDGYETLELTAKLTITSTEEMLYSAVFNGYVYFQNNLDGNRLYRATNNGTTLTKVSNDVATYFTSNGTSLYFYSGSLFSQTVKSLDGSTLSTVFNPGRSTYLACDDNGNIYYAKANLIDTKGENGIYKVDLTENDPTPVRLTTDKANYVAYYNNYVYYCNTSDGSKLYRISTAENEGTGELLVDHKVSDIIVEGGDVYFTQHDTTNSAIYKLNISSKQATKLCNDNGAYLTKVDDYIYYVNKDLLTSNIFGKGIYKVSVDGALLGLVGEKVLEADDGDGYYSLASDGSYLYFYQKNDKHFYRYNIATDAQVDLMSNFEPVESDTISAFPYAHLATYKGEIYYTNPLDSSSLYKYNTQTKQSFKVLADSVSNVYFNGDYMYYNTFILTNYAMWRLDLTDSEAEPEKISSHRYEHLTFVDDYIYALRVQPPIIVGQNNTNRIVRLDLDGQNETELYKDKNVHITSLYLVNGQFHFTINPAVGFKYIYTHDLSSGLEDATDTEIRADKFVIYGDTYYYYDQGNLIGSGTGFKSAKLDGSETKTIDSNVEITTIYEYGGVIYYTSTSSKYTGIYAYNISSGTTTKLTDKVGHGFTIMDGKLYFLNIALTYAADYPSRSSGDGHLYSVELSTGTLTKLA